MFTRQKIIANMATKLVCFQKLVSSLAQNENVLSVKTTISNIITLGLDGDHMCCLIAKASQLKHENITSVEIKAQAADDIFPVIPFQPETSPNNKSACSACVLQEGGVEELFSVCEQDTLKDAHTLALRAIATVCCVPESLEVLEKVYISFSELSFFAHIAL